MYEDPMTAPSKMKEINFCDLGKGQNFFFEGKDYVKVGNSMAVDAETIEEVDFDETELVKIEQ
jgi:hypothetical protein